MLVFGKLSIAMGTAAIGGYLCNTVPDVTSIIAPTFLILIIGYAIALLFCQVRASLLKHHLRIMSSLQVYEMGIDTVLMCFLEADSQPDFPASSLPPSIRAFVSFHSIEKSFYFGNL